MKNSIKLLCATLVMVAFGTSAYAQNTAATTASVTSTLLTNVAITKNTDVVFGQIATGTTPLMEAFSATKNFVGSSPSLGKFTVTGTAGATVKITYDATVTLTHSAGAGSGQLTFNSSVYRTELTAAAYGATLIASDGTYAVNASATGAAAGTDYFFLGGTITALGTANPIPALSGSILTGVYSGTFHISATYN